MCTEERRGAKKIDEFFFWAKNSLERSIPLVIYRHLANAIRQQVVVTVKLRQKKRYFFAFCRFRYPRQHRMFGLSEIVSFFVMTTYLFIDWKEWYGNA